MKQPIKTMREAISSFTSPTQARTWTGSGTGGDKRSSPFNVMTGIGNIQNAMSGRTNEEELRQKAPKIFPFALDNIINFMVDSYEDLMRVRTTLSNALRTASQNDAERKSIILQIKRIDTCIKLIKASSKDIEKLTL